MIFQILVIKYNSKLATLILQIYEKRTTVMELNTPVAHKYSDVFDYLKEKGFPLYEYQKVGVSWMLNREKSQKTKIRGGLLCDEPGLGKTVQTCATMYGNQKLKTLLIVPGAVIHQWVNIIKAILPNLKIYLHRGSNRAKTLEELYSENFNVAITTFGTIYKRGRNFLTVLHSMIWDRVVIDEIHYIRNPASKTAKACHALKATHKWGLTGTPIQNGIKDLKSLYNFLELPKQFMTNDGLKSVNKFLMKRRTKKMVEKYNRKLKILPLFQEIHAIEFTTQEERNFYKKIKDDVTVKYLQLMRNTNINMGNKMIEFFELLLRLRQASIHPQLVINGFSRKFNTNFQKYNGKSTKLDTLTNLLKEKTQKENCLVFCNYREEIDIIKNRLDTEGIMCCKYDGSMSLKERNQAINSFTDPNSAETLLELNNIYTSNIMRHINSFMPRVLLIQIKAGGVGINLQMFSQVFITSPDWNPSNEIQAIARAHRIGQRRPVTVHRFWLYDQDEEFSTIDQRILGIQTTKRNLMAEYLEDKTLTETGKLDMSKIKSISLQTKLTQFKLTQSNFRDLLS